MNHYKTDENEISHPDDPKNLEPFFINYSLINSTFNHGQIALEELQKNMREHNYDEMYKVLKILQFSIRDLSIQTQIFEGENGLQTIDSFLEYRSDFPINVISLLLSTISEIARHNTYFCNNFLEKSINFEKFIQKAFSIATNEEPFQTPCKEIIQCFNSFLHSPKNGRFFINFCPFISSNHSLSSMKFWNKLQPYLYSHDFKSCFPPDETNLIRMNFYTSIFSYIHDLNYDSCLLALETINKCFIYNSFLLFAKRNNIYIHFCQLIKSKLISYAKWGLFLLKQSFRKHIIPEDFLKPENFLNPDFIFQLISTPKLSLETLRLLQTVFETNPESVYLFNGNFIDLITLLCSIGENSDFANASASLNTLSLFLILTNKDNILSIPEKLMKIIGDLFTSFIISINEDEILRIVSLILKLFDIFDIIGRKNIIYDIYSTSQFKENIEDLIEEVQDLELKKLIHILYSLLFDKK